MIRKHIRKLRKVKEVPGSLSEKAASLNPLTPPTPDQPLTLENVPKITNETIAEHREDVLKDARKYIYPLQHSKHRIIVLTSIIMVGALIAFLVYCGAALYKFYHHNTFVYRITQVVPFPIARAGGSFVEYENYLFELRRYIHYYQNQVQSNLNSPLNNRDVREQIEEYRRQALKDVINQAYVKILAKQHKVNVSGKDVETRITQARNQNRLGSNNKVFADVLRDYWGWSISDFKRSLKQQILAEKVEAKLDTAASQRAADALAQLRAGADFANLAKQVSDDPAKANGGDYGFGITKTNPNVPPQVVDVLFSLKPGQVSDIIIASRLEAERPDTLEIVKVEQSDGTTVNAKHISFNLQDIAVYVKELQTKQAPKTYVKLPAK